MEVGVATSWRGATIDRIRAISMEADKLGYDYLWIPEAWGLEVFSTIGNLLGDTSRIKIGAGVVNVFSRSAAVIGMGCATLDQIAPGRFALGLGSSGRALIESWHGVKFEEAFKRTEEYVEVIKKVARGEQVDFDGEILNLHRFRLYSKPVSGDLEIYLGAMGDKNLSIAGKICDGAILTMYPISKLDSAQSLVAGGKKVFAYIHLAITESDEETKNARDEVARNIAFYVGSMGGYYARNLRRLGFQRSVEKIIERRASTQRGGSVADSVDPVLIDELSLIGSASEVMERILKFPQSVVPVFVPVPAYGQEASSEKRTANEIASLESFAREAGLNSCKLS
jgi:alkanesulfonate monooxygenase SsuD/methylene tetrahydromethanopterin reductase-like flavin-dependent oxidoreductase (luciferase family)